MTPTVRSAPFLVTPEAIETHLRTLAGSLAHPKSGRPFILNHASSAPILAAT